MFDCPDNCSRGINFESLKNLVSWFSVHLSNFRFIWNWEHWEGSYESVKDSAKYIFVKETIECCVRLSYPRNIINVTKDTLKAPADILPDVIHTVNSKFNPETIQNTKLCEAVKNIQDLIINKEDSQKIGEVLQGIDGISLEEDDSENGETVSAKHVLFDCVLVYGSKSISYLLHVLEKYQSLLKAFNKNQEEMFETLYITASFWKNNTQVLEIVIDRLSNYGIVSDETVVSWLLSEQIVESFCHR